MLRTLSWLFIYLIIMIYSHAITLFYSCVSTCFLALIACFIIIWFFSNYCMLYHYLIIYLGHLLFCLFLHGSIQIEIICFFLHFIYVYVFIYYSFNRILIFIYSFYLICSFRFISSRFCMFWLLPFICVACYSLSS